MNLPSETVNAIVSIIFTIFFHARAYAVEVVDDLKLVQLIFRHGDRAPLHTYKTDPYNATIWHNGLGRLTSIGMKQQYQAGRFYRERYSKFLDPTDSDAPNQVYIRSSDQDRTLQSAAAFSAGMFPPTTQTTWDETDLGKTWRPVSIHTVLWEEENLLSKEASCPAFIRLQDEAYDLPESRHLYRTYKDVFDFVANYSGAVAVNRRSAWENLNFVRDVVFCQHSNGHALPPWLNETMLNKMQYLSDIFFHLQLGGNEDKARARLAGGNLLALILKRMTDKVHNNTCAGENNTKAFIYSAHDSTVAGLLAALELYDYKENSSNIGIPKYTAAVLIELFNNNKVRISLKNDPTRISTLEPHILTHPRCDAFCPLDSLVEVTRSYVVNDWDKECRGLLGTEGIDVDDVTIALVTVVLVIILTTIALGCYKRRSLKPKSGQLLRDPHNSRPESNASITYTRLDQEDETL